MLYGPPVTASVTPESLLANFQASSERQRRSQLAGLQQRASELVPLIADHVGALDATGDDWAAGFLIQLLVSADPKRRDQFLERYPDGWLATTSARGIDYAPLQRLLILQDYEQADRLTSEILRQLA